MRSFRNLMTTGRVASSRLVGAAGVAAIAALAACDDAGAPTSPTVAPTSPSAALGAGPDMTCLTCSVPDYILAVRQSRTGPQIIKVKPDGSGLVVLTNGTSPAWSPNKTKIAFVRDLGNGEIFTMNPDGTGITQITNSPTTKELDPAWSPDGQYIAYTSNKNPNGAPFDRFDIWTMKADGTAPVKLTWASNRDELRPSWSKDFTKIAYMHSMNPPVEYYSVWVMTLDPATRQPVLASQVTPPQLTDNAMNPVFSPDGSKIAFDFKPGGCGISIIPADANGNGASMYAISVGGGFYCTQPTWSPNGAKLAFQVPNLWNGAIVTANAADGSGFQQVTSGMYGDFTPSWSR